ncbi:MAG TPA: FecR domain-containing protein [Candidatus Binatia bacterium]|jgi:hypothetical protein
MTQDLRSRAPLRPLLFWFALPALLFASCSQPPSGGSTEAVIATMATIDAIEGEAYVVHGGASTAAAAGDSLVAGDGIQTGAIGKMSLKLRDDSVLAIGPSTRASLDELVIDDRSRSGRIRVLVGKFWMHVTKWTGSGESRYDVSTPSAVAGVRGTTLWGDTGVDTICALEGSIEVRSLKQGSLAPATLETGHCASELSQGRLTPVAPAPEQIRKYLDEVLIGSQP